MVSRHSAADSKHPQLRSHFERAKLRDHEETLLREVVRKLNAGVAVEDVLRLIVDGAIQTTRARGAYIERITVARDEVEVVAVSGRGAPPLNARARYPGSLTEEIIQRDEPGLLADTSKIGQVASHLRRACDRCSALVVPLRSAGTLVGALVLLRTPELGSFRPEETAQASGLGDLASLALRRALLLQETQRQRQQARRFAASVDDARLYAESIVETTRAPLLVLDSELRVRTANRAFYRMFRVSPAQTEREFIYDLGHGQWDIPRLRDLLERIIPENTEFEGFEVEHEFGTIGRRTMLLNARRIYQEGEGTQMILLAIEDVTERKRAAEERERLVRGFSHDVKNPLGAAEGHLHLLEMGLKGQLTPEQQEIATKIGRSIRAALDLIDDVGELARAEAGRLKLDVQPIDVREVATEAVDDYRDRVEASGLALELELPADLPVIRSDASRIRQILGNLLSNAAKYTERGGRIGVRVVLSADHDALGPGRWIGIHISDTGPGIPPDEQDLLFQEFARVETGARPGAGLGLAISRKIARLLGGDITVESEVGVGSTFTLWLSMVVEPHWREEPEPPDDQEPPSPRQPAE